MGKKEIQEERKRRYFIEAVKEIVRDKGVGELTVKKVADLAGFAPGTLYNYFSDLNELLFYAVLDFFAECKRYVLKEVEGSKSPREKAINLAQAYARYFIENPNIYQLVFLEDIKVPEEEFAGESFVPEIVKLSAENLEACAEAGVIAAEDVEIILGLMANSIHGNLLFYIKGRSADMKQEEVIDKITREVKFVLEK